MADFIGGDPRTNTLIVRSNTGEMLFHTWESVYREKLLNSVGHEPGDDVTPLDGPEFARLRRNRLAEGFAFAIVMSGAAFDVPTRAVLMADALIAELDK